MANKNDNKSLFIYTALIFFVAVILIILSFFGQTKLNNSQPKVEESEQNQTLSGIAEKTAVLSEENKNLMEENYNLKGENEDLKELNAALQSENETLLKKQSLNDLLLSANGYYSLDNYSKALEILKQINYDELTGDQKIIYDTLNNNLQ